MIDFNEFEKYLEARSNQKYFIPRGRLILYEEVENIIRLRKKFKAAEFDKCFEKSDELGTPFRVEIKCPDCGEKEETILSNKNFRDLASEKQEFTCSSCEQKEKLKKREQEKIQSKQFYDNIQENTSVYINNYLDPEKSWQTGVKTSQKFNQIAYVSVDWQKIKYHIKSMKYYDFLKTPYWKAIAEKTKYSCGFKCQLCNSNEKLATHHRSYDIHGEEHSHWQELIVLCKNCHEKFHDKIETLKNQRAWEEEQQDLIDDGATVEEINAAWMASYKTV